MSFTHEPREEKEEEKTCIFFGTQLSRHWIKRNFGCHRHSICYALRPRKCQFGLFWILLSSLWLKYWVRRSQCDMLHKLLLTLNRFIFYDKHKLMTWLQINMRYPSTLDHSRVLKLKLKKCEVSNRQIIFVFYLLLFFVSFCCLYYIFSSSFSCPWWAIFTLGKFFFFHSWFLFICTIRLSSLSSFLHSSSNSIGN